MRRVTTFRQVREWRVVRGRLVSRVVVVAREGTKPDKRDEARVSTMNFRCVWHV